MLTIILISILAILILSIIIICANARYKKSTQKRLEELQKEQLLKTIEESAEIFDRISKRK